MLHIFYIYFTINGWYIPTCEVYLFSFLHHTGPVDVPGSSSPGNGIVDWLGGDFLTWGVPRVPRVPSSMWKDFCIRKPSSELGVLPVMETPMSSHGKEIQVRTKHHKTQSLLTLWISILSVSPKWTLKCTVKPGDQKKWIVSNKQSTQYLTQISGSQSSKQRLYGTASGPVLENKATSGARRTCGDEACYMRSPNPTATYSMHAICLPTFAAENDPHVGLKYLKCTYLYTWSTWNSVLYFFVFHLLKGASRGIPHFETHPYVGCAIVLKYLSINPFDGVFVGIIERG